MSNNFDCSVVVNTEYNINLNKLNLVDDETALEKIAYKAWPLSGLIIQISPPTKKGHATHRHWIKKAFNLLIHYVFNFTREVKCNFKKMKFYDIKWSPGIRW